MATFGADFSKSFNSYVIKAFAKPKISYFLKNYTKRTKIIKNFGFLET